AADITRGCNPPANDRYCPGDPVTRAQMASFLVRALDLAPVGPDCERWISPDGDDGAEGTRGDPWQTLQHAVEAVPGSGCVITAEPGTYEGAEIERRFDAMTTIRSAQPYRSTLRGSSMILSIDGARNVTIEGFEITQSGPSSENVMINIEDGDDRESEHIVVRNNIIHDSFENDLLKIRSGARFVTVEGNVFYNQGANEQHMDINGVRDVVVQDNLFFNDFAASGREDPGDTKAFIVVKDSSATGPEIGSRRITLRRNVFMNWQGGDETMLQIGNDGKDYHEAQDVDIESNLILANDSDTEAEAPLGVAGVADLTFANNTVVGTLDMGGFAARVETKGDNPPNEDIVLANNIYSNPDGTADDLGAGDEDDDSAELLNNLYWNGGNGFDPGEPLNTGEDPQGLIGDPLLPDSLSGVVVPLWEGSAFASGSSTVREEFIRIVETHAIPAGSSPVVDAADASPGPAFDILGRARGPEPDVGAYER
ncbi:MAG: choice-of-anchor Q domain-containing protein, partial [Actinomycetota bacterium]